MCEVKNSKRLCIGNKKYIRIDGCMKNLIELLRSKGVNTLACCCGHGRYPMTIVINRNGWTEELISGKYIPRKRNFYKKDGQEDYYIPEVIGETYA